MKVCKANNCALSPNTGEIHVGHLIVTKIDAKEAFVMKQDDPQKIEEIVKL